jgi:hypothetical protein
MKAEVEREEDDSRLSISVLVDVSRLRWVKCWSTVTSISLVGIDMVYGM